MRIVAGEWRGRALVAPKGTRHATHVGPRPRGALLSSLASLLGADLGGVAVLDAFAGSGALGLEALSRGAATAVFVESDRAARDAHRARTSRRSARATASRVVAGDAFGARRTRGRARRPVRVASSRPSL